MPQFGVYVHIPFCERRCHYCDFNTYDGMSDRWSEYVDALCLEIRSWAPACRDASIGSVFIGGGTPTVLSMPLLSRILDALRTSFAIADGAEITCEANPGTVDRSRFEALRDLGVTRLSLGVQSFEDDDLTFLGRMHTADQAVAAFRAARAAGFDNLSLDLMFGLPNQSVDAWARTLRQALALVPEHVSLYHLTVEPGTPLARTVASGSVIPMDDDRAAELYELAMDTLRNSGYIQYEVSNWARAGAVDGATPSLASRHNLVYWRNTDYIGVGAGAHGHLLSGTITGAGAPGHLLSGTITGAGAPSLIDLGRLSAGTAAGAGAPSPLGPGSLSAGTAAARWWNVKSVPLYVERALAGNSVVDGHEELDAATSMGETMILGLRLLNEGVSFRRFARRHGADPRDVYRSELQELTGLGLLEVTDERARLTRRGLMIGNRVFERFVSEG